MKNLFNQNQPIFRSYNQYNPTLEQVFITSTSVLSYTYTSHLTRIWWLTCYYWNLL